MLLGMTESSAYKRPVPKNSALAAFLMGLYSLPAATTTTEPELVSGSCSLFMIFWYSSPASAKPATVDPRDRLTESQPSTIASSMAAIKSDVYAPPILPKTFITISCASGALPTTLQYSSASLNVSPTLIYRFAAAIPATCEPWSVCVS